MTSRAHREGSAPPTDSGADTTAQEIEQTLAQSRASSEQRIALYRVWVVGVVGLLSIWPFLSGGSAFSFIVSSIYLVGVHGDW